MYKDIDMQTEIEDIFGDLLDQAFVEDTIDGGQLSDAYCWLRANQAVREH
jgi:hypothetical protein